MQPQEVFETSEHAVDDCESHTTQSGERKKTPKSTRKRISAAGSIFASHLPTNCGPHAGVLDTTAVNDDSFFRANDGEMVVCALQHNDHPCATLRQTRTCTDVALFFLKNSNPSENITWSEHRTTTQPHALIFDMCSNGCPCANLSSNQHVEQDSRRQGDFECVMERHGIAH